jgi:hypothetical protein
MSIYLMGVYGDAESAFREEYQSTGKRLDMGKCCVRFRKVDDLPLEVIGRAVARFSVREWIAVATAAWAATKTGKKKAAATGSAGKKPRSR